jgi:hypothetical protein
VTPAAAAAVARRFAGKEVAVRTTYGQTVTGRVVKATGRALVIDTGGPGDRGFFLPQVDSVRPVTKHKAPQTDAAQLPGLMPSRLPMAAEGAVELRDYSDATRRAYAKRGWALEDGSFPIRTKKDVGNAVNRLHNAPDQTKARAHIVKRARKLGATDLLPGSWPESTKTETAARLDRIERAVVSMAAVELAPPPSAA